jgi:hypothetical protein
MNSASKSFVVFLAGTPPSFGSALSGHLCNDDYNELECVVVKIVEIDLDEGELSGIVDRTRLRARAMPAVETLDRRQ